MNDTPETDAVAGIEGNLDTKALRMRDFACKLERERNELIDALSSVLVDTTSTYGYLESHIDAEQTLKQILSTR